MGEFIDLTGQQFNRWKVIKRVDNNKFGQAMWLCKCDCNGKNSERIVAGNSLRNEKSQCN